MGELLSPRAEGQKEFAFHLADFEAVRTRLKSLTGINLADSKDSMVYSRLSRRIRSLGMRSFAQYLKHLESDERESEQFVNALTTNLTSFFRESHHFDALKEFIAANPKPLKIWCAAASSGEEPYSIAIACAEARGSHRHNIDILASDIDSAVLSKAKTAVYPLDAVRKLSEERKKAFFLKGKGSNTGKVKVRKELVRKVQFFQQNLLDEKWAVNTGIDVIFCRNVMIYFDRPTQHKIVERFIHIMNHNGLYIAGHSENFAKLPAQFRALGKTVYRCTKREAMG